MKNLLLVLSAFLVFQNSNAQISAKLMRYMDVSDKQITFVYGGDIWIVAKTGGTAVQITHSPGEESWPKFSLDGKEIAYTANYNGNSDIFVIKSFSKISLLLFPYGIFSTSSETTIEYSGKY